MARFFPLILILFLAFPLMGENSLEELLQQTGSRLNWDPFSQKGDLQRGNKQVGFQVNNPYFLLDGELERVSPPTLKDGTLYFTSQGYEKIVNFLMDGNAIQREQTYSVSVILLDPGHGGRDWGAYRQYEVDGINTYLKEKNINLDVGLRVAQILQQRFPDKEIALTRNDDRYVSLQERVDAAEKYEFSPREGMVFLSIHTNASLNTRGKGFEIWYLPDSFDRDLAHEEGNELNQVLNALWEEVFNRESYNLSRLILEEMENQHGDVMLNRGLKQNSWYMLRNQNMASCLVELAFLTNSEEATMLRETEHLEKSSMALADGITAFIEYFENQ